MNPKDAQVLQQFEEEINTLNVNKHAKHGLALHKPITLLYVLSKLNSGTLSENKIRYSSIEEELGELITRYGGRKTKSGPNPNLPYYHLKTSGIWTINGLENIEIGKSGSPKITELRDPTVHASLSDDLFTCLKNNPDMIAHAASVILQKWWPETIQENIKDDLGLVMSTTGTKRRRDPAFAPAVLKNYRNQCAFCGFSASFKQRVFGLDAAHIMWHASNGPDKIENGLALCKIHHFAFDMGVLGVNNDLKILLSDEFVGMDDGSQHNLETLSGLQIGKPKDAPPSSSFINWHLENVFLGKT